MTPEQIEKAIAEVSESYKDKPRSELIAGIVIGSMKLEKQAHQSAAMMDMVERTWLFANHLIELLRENGIELPIEPTNEYIALAKSELHIRMNWEHATRQLAVESDRKGQAKNAVDIRHDKKGGSRDTKTQLRAIWAQGNFLTRDDCAEQERFAFRGADGKTELSFSAARKHLRNTPDPYPWHAKEQVERNKK